MADEFIATFEIKEEQKMTANFEMGNNGTKEHDKLLNRDLPEQHPISSITGLTEALEERVVNNPTITITQGGETKGSFTLNQNTNQTIDLDAGGGGTSIKKQLYIISNLIPSGQTSITTLNVSSDFSNVIDVLKNGIEIYENYDYTIANGIITFITALTADDKICVKGEE